MADAPAAEEQGHRFGTFGGVFTPSMLTIFGLIMFMRANHVVGQAGVLFSLVILALATAIVFLTGLSISAISSNTPVKGGGAYFLISRVLGPGFGTAIGIALFVAQAISVPFYILGFVEALTDTFPQLKPWHQLISLAVLGILFVMTWVGTGWVIRLQYGILAVLLASIAIFLYGAWQVFDLNLFKGNLEPHYSEGAGFWKMFALYFPAVTGIMAGVNMSGDLKDPSRSIPIGTMAAVIVGFLVYAVQIFLGGGMAPREQLIAEPYLLLVTNAAFGLGWLVTLGVFCATVSSAIGSNLGAPRVLQAVGRDEVLPLLNPFGKSGEPRRALILTFGIGLATLILAGATGGGGLDMVAQVVSMVFLYTYGMTNLAAFVESLGANPSFRPRFRYFHWWTALIGGIACVAAAFMINFVAAVLALVFISGLFYVVRSRELQAAYGDARRGFIYSRVRNNLVQLAAMPPDPRNWRPTIMVFSGSPYQRLALIEYARWIGQKSGIVSLVHVLEGSLDDARELKAKEEARLNKFIAGNGLNLFGEVVVMADFDSDLSVFLQSHSIGPIKPNLVFMGWPTNPDRLAPYYEHLRTVQQLGKSLVVLLDHGTMVGSRGQRRIDCWWRGRQNGSLIFILAHLLTLNPEWNRTRLRVLRQVPGEDTVAAAREELDAIVTAARISAEIVIPVSPAPFAEVLREQSEDATLIFLGLTPPPRDTQETFHERMTEVLTDMPSTLLVYSSGDADLQA